MYMLSTQPLSKKSISVTVVALCFSALLISCRSDHRSDHTQANNMVDNAKEPVEQVVIREDLSIENSEIVEGPSDVLLASVQSHLSSQNKSLGTVNNDGSIYATGSATTGIPSNRNGFINSRNIAFQKAELRAKLNILRTMGELFTSERAFNQEVEFISGDDPDARKKATIIEKAQRLVDSSLDFALRELGVSEAEIAQMNDARKEQVYSDRFSSYVNSYVAHMIRGVAVIKITEGEIGNNDYEVAVAVKYSPENQAIASNQQELGADKAVLNSASVNEIRNSDPENLVSQLGARLFKDENDNFYVVGFGQSSVRKSENRQSSFVNIASRKARLRAVENIKNFLAEDLVAQELESTVEDIYELSDGSQGIYTENNFSQFIQSKVSTVQMNTLKIRDWDGVHPVSNSRLVGAVVILTESNSVNFSNTGQANTTDRSSVLESSSFDDQDF